MAMIAPELNTPRHPWYQRRYHVKIPRQAESRQYLDGALLSGVPPVAAPIGWDFGMRVGLGPGSQVGMQTAAGGSVYGAINPSNFMDKPIVRFHVSTTPSALLMVSFPGEQIPGINTVTWTTEGFGAITMGWSAPNLRYQVTSAPLRTYLLTKVGQVVGVTLVGSALLRFEQPYPWEAFTTQTQINDFVEETDLDVPPGWFAMTLVAKKAYLKATYGEPAP